MLIDCPDSLLSDPSLSPSAKLVLLVLSGLDTPFHTYDELRARCGLSLKEFRSAVKLLCGERTAKRKPKNKWIKTRRVKSGDSTKTEFTILHNMTKGNVYRGEATLQKGMLGGTNMTKGKVTPTSINLPKGNVCGDTNMTKGKVCPDVSSLTKELTKVNSNNNNNIAHEDLALFGEEEMEATKEFVPISAIYKIYNDVRTMVRGKTGLPGYKGVRHTTEKREKWASFCWADEKTWNRSLEKVKVFFETAATYDNYNLSGRNKSTFRAEFLYMTQNEQRRTEINEEVRRLEREPDAQTFTNKWGEFYETV